MSKPDALLPCPFCGGTAIRHNEAAYYWASCDRCETEGPVCVSQAEAIAAWNRRAGQSHTDGLVAALEEARDVFQHYGDLHATKPDPVKAQRNYDLAAKMTAALTAAKGQQQ